MEGNLRRCMAAQGLSLHDGSEGRGGYTLVVANVKRRYDIPFMNSSWSNVSDSS
jgi:hypothetical protein